MVLFGISYGHLTPWRCKKTYDIPDKVWMGTIRKKGSLFVHNFPKTAPNTVYRKSLIWHGGRYWARTSDLLLVEQAL